MTRKVILISKSYNIDSIGQKIPTETEKEVFAEISSVSLKEYATAGAIGLKPSMMVMVWGNEYNEEEVLEYNDKRYSIYRTFKPGNGRVELYVQKDVGV